MAIGISLLGNGLVFSGIRYVLTYRTSIFVAIMGICLSYEEVNRERGCRFKSRDFRLSR